MIVSMVHRLRTTCSGLLLGRSIERQFGFVRTTSQQASLVLTEKQDNIFMIQINRPEVRNCVSQETEAQLVKAFTEFENDKNMSVAVLYGKGGYFCGGFDLKTLSQMDENYEWKVREPAVGLIEHSKWRPLGCTHMVFSKPVIAAVQGYAVAGGLELACQCDLRVVEQSAVMGVFCRRFGVPLLDGGTVRLQKIIGLSRALDVILTGRPINSKEALEFGLANRVVPDGKGVEEAIKLAKEIASFPSECMEADRRATYYSAYDAKSFDDAFKYEWENGSPVIHKESVQGATRFVKGQGRHGSFDLKKPSKL